MINPNTGAPHTAHTTNPVPFIVKAPEGAKVSYRFMSDEEAGKGEKKGETDEGALCDVAPTILEIMVCDFFSLRSVWQGTDLIWLAIVCFFLCRVSLNLRK